MKRTIADEEEEYDDYGDDYAYIDDDDDPPHRPVAGILAAVTLVCLLALAGFLAFRFYSDYASQSAPVEDSDPALLLHSARVEEESELKVNPIEEITDEAITDLGTEVTTEPTIPPEANPFNQYDFQYNRRNYLTCMKQESYAGVDVSAFQKDIDWRLVKGSGIQFAMLRLGYRGWGAKGTLVEDEYIQKNLAGATAAGLSIGAYFFSQATTLDEVNEEIEFMLDILGDYRLDYPIVLDWEIADPNGRVNGVDRRSLTNMLRYFCDEMSARGFEPMVYFNWTQASKMIHLNELEDYPFWLALYQDRMTFPYRVEMWQYTSEGKVPGIEGDVDINVYIPDLRPGVQ